MEKKSKNTYVYNLVIVRREDTCSDPEIKVQTFAKRKDAIKAINELFDREVKERELDLTDPSNDGICYCDGDDHFAFYTWVGGDWDYDVTLYRRTLVR